MISYVFAVDFMKKPIISLIAAIGENRELGKNNQLLWRLEKDMEHFKEITSGHPVIMGRKTFESIGHPLPNRTNIVVSHDKDFHAEGAHVFSSLEKAIEYGKEACPAKPEGRSGEIFIIGGASIYAQGIKFADKLYLTLVKASRSDADAFFPDYSNFKKVLKREEKQEGEFEFTFLELMR